MPQENANTTELEESTTVTEPVMLDSTGLLIKNAIETLAGNSQKIGELTNLDTTAKANLVAAINELAGNRALKSSVELITEYKNAGNHAQYRGKNLGTSIPVSFWEKLADGSFDDQYVGDYFLINNIHWRLAHPDYWLHCGDTECTTHHWVIVPDENLLNADGSTTKYMNDQNTTDGGYMGSGFFSGTQKGGTANTAKASCRAMAVAAFGAAHILTHRECFTNAMTNGKPSGGAWTDSDIDMMNERMVYGNPVFEPAADGTTIPALYTIDKSQLALFAQSPSLICNRADWWLRVPVSASDFAVVGSYGTAACTGAAVAWIGVRPAFGIC